MPLTGDHITTALHAMGAGDGKVTTAAKIADLFNAAMAVTPEAFDTPEKVAALVATCAQESAYFRTTEEYPSKYREAYAPFWGRTFVQVTHDYNYRAFGAWTTKLGLTAYADVFIDHPTALSDLRWAALGGVWYFTQVKFPKGNLLAYAGDILAVSRAVNLGSPTSRSVPLGIGARTAAYKAVLALGRAIVPDPPSTVPAAPTPATPPPEVPPVPTPTPPKPTPVTWKHTDSFGGQRYRWWRGGNMTPTGIAVCEAVPSTVELSQGGLSNSVPASGQTHNGLGAYDVKVKGWSKSKVLTLCAELIRSGECAFPRGGLFGSAFFVQHVHVASKNNYSSLHPTAQAQVKDFEHKPRRNGLAGHGSYVGPSTPLGDWPGSPYNPANIRPAVQAQYRVVSGTLQGLDIDRRPRSGKLRKRGFVIDAVRLVRRWGRWNVVTSVGTFYAVKDSSQTYLEPIVPPAPPAAQPSQETP